MNADEPPPTIPSPAGRGPAVLLLSVYPQAVGVASGGGTGVQRVLTPSVRPSCWAARVDDYQTVKTVSEQASDKWKIAACATIRSERKHRLVRRNLLVTHLTIVSRHNATLTMTRRLATVADQLALSSKQDMWPRWPPPCATFPRQGE